jgi:hypothetical protein
MIWTRPDRLALGLLLGVSALAFAACDVNIDASSQTARDKRQFTVTGTPDVRLVTFDGAIEVRAWDRPEVYVEIEKRGRSQQVIDSIEVKAEQDGNKVTVEARRAGPTERSVHIGFHVSPSARLIASVPRQANLVIETADGSVVIERVTGRMDVRTGDGSITGESLNGQLRLHTGDGSVKLTDVEGRLDADTGDGGMTIDGKLAGLRAVTGDGSITVRLDGGSVMAEDWEVRTGDGGISIELPDAFDANLEAHTGDGFVRLLAASNEDRERRDLQATIGNGGRVLKLRTGDGSIRVQGSARAGRIH